MYKMMGLASDLGAFTSEPMFSVSDLFTPTIHLGTEIHYSVGRHDILVSAKVSFMNSEIWVYSSGHFPGHLINGQTSSSEKIPVDMCTVSRAVI